MKWDEMDERARDYFLAENVMGWHVGGPFKQPEGWYDEHGNPKAWIESWHPTTDITAAMGLAEAMRKQGYFVKVILRQEGHKARHKYYCEVEERMGERPNDATDVYIGNTDTLPDSIAYACFLALGGEE